MAVQDLVWQMPGSARQPSGRQGQVRLLHIQGLVGGGSGGYLAGAGSALG